jgi:hypothetical protein
MAESENGLNCRNELGGDKVRWLERSVGTKKILSLTALFPAVGEKKEDRRN